VEVRFFATAGLGVGWVAPEPKLIERTSHALEDRGRVWVVDPVAGDEVEQRIRVLGEPAGVLQLVDRHERDCEALAALLDIPLYRLPFEGVPGAPFVPLRLLDRRGWREVALWWPSRRALVCAEAVGTAPHYLGPGERLAVHPLLRPRPPRWLRGLAPEHVLCGHGEGIHGREAASALDEALSTARRRAPRWLWHQLSQMIDRKLTGNRGSAG
jgi:hypothetical protein